MLPKSKNSELFLKAEQDFVEPAQSFLFWLQYRLNQENLFGVHPIYDEKPIFHS